MPKTAKELERLILADGWKFNRQNGSHRTYTHPTILKQAGLLSK